MNFAAVSREIDRIRMLSPRGARSVGETLWNLGVNYPLVRQIDTIRFIKKFETIRQTFFQEFWERQAKLVDARLITEDDLLKIEMPGRVLEIRGGQILSGKGVVGQEFDPGDSIALDWHRSHPIYSSDYKSIINLLFLDGELIEAVRCGPPLVRGDGESSIYELVRKENNRRIAAKGWFALNPLLVDTRTRLFLLINNLQLDDVPELGKDVQIKFGTEENNRFSNEGITGEVTADLLQACAGLFGKSREGLFGVILGCEAADGIVERAACSLLGVSSQPNLTPFILSRNPQTSVSVMNHVFGKWITAG